MDEEESKKNPNLWEIFKNCQTCTSCALCETRTNVVFGSGNPLADVLIIGEAPGKNEDQMGEPFVGAAGKKLQALLEIAGLSRNDIYIANIVKCRPPNNRNPKPAEITACTPHLARQIEAINPAIVVTLGTFSSQYVLDTKDPITKLRGTVVEKRGAPYAVLPIYHPAAAMYDPKKQVFLEEDFKLLRTWLEKHVNHY